MAENVTLKDVAAVAGVSVSTASRVLNGTGRVSEETRERILLAARRLRFQPNALARSFATGRSLTVGILAKSALSTFTMPVLIGATAVLGAEDLAALTYNMSVSRAKQDEQLAKLLSRHVDGILVIGDGMRERTRSVTANFTVPVVYVFGPSDDDDDVVFVPDNRQAGRLAGEHLLSLGRRHIAHITASADAAADERAAGLHEVLAAAGVELVGGAPLRGDWTTEWGTHAMRRLLESGQRVDGVFCGDDWIALGASAALRDAGLRTPDDVALIGFDNIGTLVDRPAHLLSTIDPQLSELGEAAALHLLDAMRGGPVLSGHQLLPCVLVPGESTIGRARGARDGVEALTGL